MLFHSSELLFSFTRPFPGITLSTSQPSVFIDGQLFPNLLFQFSQLDNFTWMSWRHFKLMLLLKLERKSLTPSTSSVPISNQWSIPLFYDFSLKSIRSSPSSLPLLMSIFCDLFNSLLLFLPSVLPHFKPFFTLQLD